MEKFGWDESKYLENLDLNSARTSLFKNLTASVKTLFTAQHNISHNRKLKNDQALLNS